MREIALTLLTPLDQVRNYFLRLLGPFKNPIIHDREKRIALITALSLPAALLLAVFFPIWMVALGPVLWGIPHVVADFRYLLIQNTYIQKNKKLLIALVPIIITSFFSFGLPVVLGLSTVGGIILASSNARRIFICLLFAPFFYLSIQYSYDSQLIFVHAHNIIAIVLWCVMAKKYSIYTFVPLALFGAGVFLIMSGATDMYVTRVGVPSTYNLDEVLFWFNLPYFQDIPPMRWTLFFVFSQSMHYIVWLRMVPQETHKQDSPRPFKKTYRELVKEFSFFGILFIAASSLFFIIYGAIDLYASRALYLQTAGFHGYVELMILALFIAKPQKNFS